MQILEPLDLVNITHLQADMGTWGSIYLQDMLKLLFLELVNRVGFPALHNASRLLYALRFNIL